jgi:hypothetical protein
MRRVVVPVAVVAAACVSTAVAFAAQVNVYTVEGSITPNQGASKAQPRPIQLKFSFQVKEAGGQRPSPIKTYSIGFWGGRSNGGRFPKCTAQQINATQSDAACPKGSQVGTAVVKNAAGSTADPADTSVKCDLTMKIYNAGVNRAALFLEGAPPDCVISINQAVDAKFVSAFGGKGQALEFSIPANLLHPIPGLDNAQVDVSSTIFKKTIKAKGRTQGYFVVDQACPKNGKAPIAVTFTSEAGESKTATADNACRP